MKRSLMVVALVGVMLVAMVSWVSAQSSARNGEQKAAAPKSDASKAILINHEDTNITRLTLADIQAAKKKLHIAYGHTSHGSQLTTGMEKLVGFANAGGKGLKHPKNTFAFNAGGRDGALDLHDGAMKQDVGYYPQWENETRKYLNDPAHKNCNVVLWSWCGQVTDKFKSGKLNAEYLQPMAQLEADYPQVTFVYMTGHLDHGADADNKAANQAIRDYCAKNGKVLYDFADIEQYNPDGKYFEYASDGCDYYASAKGKSLGNWATQWQDAHVKGTDWYECSSAHSQPLNANQKAYAAWALFCEIAKTR